MKSQQVCHAVEAEGASERGRLSPAAVKPVGRQTKASSRYRTKYRCVRTAPRERVACSPGGRVCTSTHRKAPQPQSREKQAAWTSRPAGSVPRNRGTGGRAQSMLPASCCLQLGQRPRGWTLPRQARDLRRGGRGVRRAYCRGGEEEGEKGVLPHQDCPRQQEKNARPESLVSGGRLISVHSPGQQPRAGRIREEHEVCPESTVWPECRRVWDSLANNSPCITNSLNKRDRRRRSVAAQDGRTLFPLQETRAS